MKSETTVGDEIEQTEGGWEFDADVASEFDSHVSKSIPNYHWIQTQTAKLADWFIRDGERTRVYDLGCATGTTIERLIETQDRTAPVQYVGIDEARPMLSQAGEKIGHNDAVRLVEEDITVDPQFPNASVVISLFTLSFLAEEDRKRVLEAIYTGLDSGGVLLFCEKTYPEHSRFQAIFREHYFDYKRQYFDEAEVLGKAETLRGQLRPVSREEYREMLTTAGFDQVEPWYQTYMWLGVIARKQ